MTVTESNMGVIGGRAFLLSPSPTQSSRADVISERGRLLYRVVAAVGGEQVAVYTPERLPTDTIRGVAAAVIADRARGDEARKLRQAVLSSVAGFGLGPS